MDRARDAYKRNDILGHREPKETEKPILAHSDIQVRVVLWTIVKFENGNLSA